MNNIKLTIVVGVLNQFELSMTTIKKMVENLARPEQTELIVIDNGSDTHFNMNMRDAGLANAIVVRNEKNAGNYPLFKQGYELAKGEVVAFLHSDVFVHQKGWDEAVVAQFDGREDLGLVGFIGSTEIDNWGGRGGGTISNMKGYCVKKPESDGSWCGSAGVHHGKVSGGMTIDGSVVDGCVMIFRKSVLGRLAGRENLPPHHFYDRLMSVQVVELGFKVGILGVEFDHVSGQVANHEQKWQDTSKEWFKAHMGIDTPQEWAEVRKEWVNNPRNPSRGKIPDQYDYAAYLEGEYQFLSEYRDEKKLVPLVYGKRV